MDVCALSHTPWHIPRYMSWTSNNKRCQLIIYCVFCNSGCKDLAYDDVRYTVYRWGFSYLDYSFSVLISWSRKLGLYCWFCHICFHRVLLRISDIIIIILLLYMFRSWLPLVLYSTSLLFLLYYTMHVPCLISLTISACALCICSRHDFQYMLFWFGFIDTRVSVHARHLALALPLVELHLTTLDSYV